MIARWEVEPLVRSRRGLDERLVLGAPWLMRALGSLAVRASAGSPVRRVVLSYATRVGVAANNRRDYEAMCAVLSPDIELHVYPDAPEVRWADVEPIYHGHDGYVKGTEELRAGFGSFRWEVLELIDPGGDRFAVRTDRVGRSGFTGLEVRALEYNVVQLERGLVRRQWSVSTETAMLALLQGRQASPSAPADARVPHG